MYLTLASNSLFSDLELLIYVWFCFIQGKVSFCVAQATLELLNNPTLPSGQDNKHSPGYISSCLFTFLMQDIEQGLANVKFIKSMPDHLSCVPGLNFQVSPQNNYFKITVWLMF